MTETEQARDKSQTGMQAFTFPNLLAVHKHLLAHGWKISQSGLYKHRNEGRIKPGKDGTFSAGAVERYARVWLARADGAGAVPPPEDPEEKELERRMLRANTESAEFKRDRLRQDLITGPLERELAKRLLLLRSDAENFIRSNAADLIASVAGDQARAPEMVSLYLAASEKWFTRYASCEEFQIDSSGAVAPGYPPMFAYDTPTEPPDSDANSATTDLNVAAEGGL